MREIEYDRQKAVDYAQTWAKKRNPEYVNFDNYGGDCTNFISQALYAGCGVMNMTPGTGWFYIDLKRRAPSWTGVEFLYRFLTANRGAGPYGQTVEMSEVKTGDVIQLDFNEGFFDHTLLVVGVGRNPQPENILIASHTFDSYDRPLSTYNWLGIRFIAINGARGE